MQPDLRKLDKKSLVSSIFLFAIFALFTLLSCNEKNAKHPTCVKLTKKQIDNWEKKGFTSGKNPIVYLWVKTAYAGAGTTFRTFVTGMTADGKMVPESFIELQAGDKCEVSFDDTYMVSGASYFKFPYNKLFENGSLKKGIKEIILVPESKQENGFWWLNYTMSSQEGVFSLEKDESTGILCPPCPNCIPPNPPKCVDQYMDSTAAIN